MEFTGERVVFDNMKGSSHQVRLLRDHLERYVWALPFVHNKRVVDAACGTGYGTWLLSLVTEWVDGVDIDPESIKYAQQFEEVNGNLSFGVADVENMILVDTTEVIVSFETIEHLDNSEKFLKGIKAPELIFSIPINHNGKFHKHVYPDSDSIRKLLSDTGWNIQVEKIQREKYFLGVATRD